MSAVGINDGLPIDMAKMALWRHGLPNPTVFLVKEDDGRKVMDEFSVARRSGQEGVVLSFDTYNDGNGRRSTTVLDAGSIVGVTLEFASIQFSGG